MSDRRTYSGIYIEGSTVRKSTPDVRHNPYRHQEQAPQRRQNTHTSNQRRISRKADRALAFDAKYTMFVAASVLVIAIACVSMLYMESRIKAQKSNIESMEAELETILNDNDAYRMSLESMYSLDDIYDVATNELGMVYAKKGQIVYYNSANEDYVKQYQDVPEAN